tara:strand:+ start:1160 stop:1405 length:246 start_codon:yes stop_codon:yes gene_type:complete
MDAPFKVGKLATYWPTSYYTEDTYIPEPMERKIAMVLEVDDYNFSDTFYKILYDKKTEWVPECHMWDFKHYELWHHFHGKK